MTQPNTHADMVLDMIDTRIRDLEAKMHEVWHVNTKDTQ